MGKDFLVHDGGPSGEDTFLHTLNDHIREQNDLLRRLLVSSGKRQPTVRCETVVHNSGRNAAGIPNYITDNNPHRITFEIGGKPVMVHRIMYWAYDTAINIHLQLEPSVGSGAGFEPYIDTVNNTPFPTVLDISVSELWVRGSSAATTNPYFVNQDNSGISISTIYVYGWTTDDWEFGFSARKD